MTVKQTTTLLYGVVAILLLLCLLDMPYGYYVLVRIVSAIAFCFFAYIAKLSGREVRMVFFIILAVVFQPIIKFPLGREVWNIVDVCIAIYLLYLLFTVKDVKTKSSSTSIKKRDHSKDIMLAISLLFCLSANAQNIISERRVYYLDATYSMIKPSKLWDPVRKDLAKAIQAIEDENTEIYVIAFGGNHGSELKEWHGFANQAGKDNIIAGFMGFTPKANTMTYLDRPLNDFYSGKVAHGKVTYCFLMTDGKDENKNTNLFPDALKKWGGKYGDQNVYGFYVMLNKEAKDSSIESIIDKQDHLWKVETADINMYIPLVS